MKSKYLGQMAPDLYQKYKEQGFNQMDPQIRKAFKIPTDRYYSVVDQIASDGKGKIFLDLTRKRVLKRPKISKSN